jgi:hypothetical protein
MAAKSQTKRGASKSGKTGGKGKKGAAKVNKAKGHKAEEKIGT